MLTIRNDQHFETYQAFINLEKTFNRVPRSIFEESLKNRDIDKSLFKNNQNYVRKDNMQSHKFAVNEGLHQDVLSPVIFNLRCHERYTRQSNKTICRSQIYGNGMH